VQTMNMLLCRYTQRAVRWFIRNMIVLTYLSLQCGIVNVGLFFLAEPCGVSMVEVFAAPVVGTIAMFLIVFADNVQTKFLAQDELVWSLSAARLGHDHDDDLAMWARLTKYASAIIMAQMPVVFVRGRTVLGTQTALSMLRNESGSQERTVYVHCARSVSGLAVILCDMHCALLSPLPHLCSLSTGAISERIPAMMLRGVRQLTTMA